MFMTGNCIEVKNALVATWPGTQQTLSMFYLQHQVWRWLLDSRHGISHEVHEELMVEVKKLLSAKSNSTFLSFWELYKYNPLSKKYPGFTR